MAENLIQLNNTNINKEIIDRTVINRLYYGVFHLVQEKYKFTAPPNGTHEAVIKFVKNFGCASNYKDLFDLRVDADYFHLKKIYLQDALQLKEELCSRLMEPSLYETDEDELIEFRKIKGHLK